MFSMTIADYSMFSLSVPIRFWGQPKSLDFFGTWTLDSGLSIFCFFGNRGLLESSCFIIPSCPPCPWARPCTGWGCWPGCPPCVRGPGAGARWRSSPRPAQCPHWGPGSGPGAGGHCGQPASDVTWWQYQSSSHLEYPLEAGVMYGPGRDLAQEADLTAQVVVEVSQAPVVTVVHPAMIREGCLPVSKWVTLSTLNEMETLNPKL